MRRKVVLNLMIKITEIEDVWLEGEKKGCEMGPQGGQN